MNVKKKQLDEDTALLLFKLADEVDTEDFDLKKSEDYKKFIKNVGDILASVDLVDTLSDRITNTKANKRIKELMLDNEWKWKRTRTIRKFGDFTNKVSHEHFKIVVKKLTEQLGT